MTFTTFNFYRITLGAHKARLKALNDPDVQNDDDYERETSRYALQNLHELPIDFEMTQARRAFLERQEAAEQWTIDNFSLEEGLARISAGKHYAGCPIGNFEAAEQYHIKRYNS